MESPKSYVEETVGQRRQSQEGGRRGARVLAEERHRRRVAAEGVDVGLDPAQRRQLVVQRPVARRSAVARAEETCPTTSTFRITVAHVSFVSSLLAFGISWMPMSSTAHRMAIHGLVLLIDVNR